METDGLKPSRLLLTLDSRISTAATPLAADCLRAERAMYLARQGISDEVASVLGGLRRRYEDCPDVAITVWVNLCEGLASHFSDMGPQARDKIRRAHALSEACGLPQLQALTAAWSAHMAYLDASFEAMAQHLAQALTLAAAENHGARSRASLVAALAFHVAGRFDLAHPWYEATRQHAVQEGDDATLSALLHNASWLRAANLRHDILLRGLTVEDSEHALMSAESSLHFDRFVGAKSLQSLTPVLRAQILAVLGRPAEAIELYDRHLEASVAQGLGRTIEPDLLADRAWCHAVTGDFAHARRHADAALARLRPDGHCVDRVVAHKRLAQVLAALGEPDAAATQDALAAEAWSGHRREQDRILTALVPLGSALAQNTAMLSLRR